MSAMEVSEPGPLLRNSPEWATMTATLERCLVPGLARPADELRTDWAVELADFFAGIEPRLLQVAEMLPSLVGRIRHDQLNIEFVTTFVHLLYEMDPDTPWTRSEGYSEHCERLYGLFASTFQLDLRTQFPNGKLYEQLGSDIFKLSMEKLHKKITKDTWKYHPGSVYCFRAMTVIWTELHKVRCPWPLIFPGIFLQTDDYDEENVLDGLNCCLSVLKNVKYIDSEQNGYETVIYDAMAKYVQFRESSIMIGKLECLLLLLPKMGVLKYQTKWTQVDDVLDMLLDGLGLETVRDKRKIYCIYIRKMIKVNGNSAIRLKKKVLSMLSNGLEMCLGANEVIYDDLVEYVNCLEAWLQVGWPIWLFSKDREFILLMLKVLYYHTDCKENDVEIRCLVLMLSLCDDSQKREFLSEEYTKVTEFDSNFQQMWHHVMGKIKYEVKTEK